MPRRTHLKSRGRPKGKKRPKAWHRLGEQKRNYRAAEGALGLFLDAMGRGS